jgi:hypothetical protein
MGEAQRGEGLRPAIQWLGLGGLLDLVRGGPEAQRGDREHGIDIREVRGETEGGEVQWWWSSRCAARQSPATTRSRRQGRPATPVGLSLPVIAPPMTFTNPSPFPWLAKTQQTQASSASCPKHPEWRICLIARSPRRGGCTLMTLEHIPGLQSHRRLLMPYAVDRPQRAEHDQQPDPNPATN